MFTAEDNDEPHLSEDTETPKIGILDKPSFYLVTLCVVLAVMIASYSTRERPDLPMSAEETHLLEDARQEQICVASGGDVLYVPVKVARGNRGTEMMQARNGDGDVICLGGGKG